MNLDERLSRLLAGSSASLSPRPVEAVIRRGRQRRLRRRVAVAGALTVLALAGGTAGLLSRPAEPAERQLPAAPAPVSRAPQPTGLFAGTTPVTLAVSSSAAKVMAGYDDDDRVLVSGAEGKDPELRNRWLIVPDGGAFALRLAVERPAGWVCASRADDGTLHLRLCLTGAAAQRFTLTTADDETYALLWGGSPVRIGAGGALAAGGTGAVVRLTVARA
ncbi:hypothetical protein [Paractinoplanes atraurantiacus]|uniref:Ricin B lectin domain-containing protein n=1 Tax=Paractinoplanes atraurantiacus TaxID=1036182 RepID=A0A285J001_9ACTN|nr:hypothetical protein [Actinoplanes atraurantiacus]SNY53538.1 hypothetical protein SAMN05421748_11447 [Actinoplanes atraurantiacus]